MYLMAYFGLVFIVSSCKSNLFKKEIQVIVNPYSYWNPADPENLNKYINPEKYEITKHFLFKVNGINGSEADTFIFSRDELDGKKFGIQCNTTLTLNKSLTVKQMEEFLSYCGIENHNLRYKLTWLSKLTSASIHSTRNQYGDVTGYYAISGYDIIPGDFYSLSSDYQRIIPNEIILAEKKYVENMMTITLKLGTQFSVFDNFIEFHGTDVNFKPCNGYRIAFTIRIIGCILVNHVVLFSNYSELFPFKYTYEEL